MKANTTDMSINNLNKNTMELTNNELTVLKHEARRQSIQSAERIKPAVGIGGSVNVTANHVVKEAEIIYQYLIKDLPK